MFRKFLFWVRSQSDGVHGTQLCNGFAPGCDQLKGIEGFSGPDAAFQQ